MSRLFLMLALSILGTTIGCSGGTPTEPPALLQTLPRPLTAAERQTIAASNGFAFALLREIDRTQPDANLFVSPLSVSLSLGMAMNGARGSTLDSMRTTLGVGGLSLSDINTSYRDLIQLLQGLDSRIEFAIANSMWSRQDFPIEAAFTEAGRSYFDAEVRSLDFSSPTAVKTINDWIAGKTRNRITNMLSAIGDAEILFLINAIYFKGAWRDRFNSAETQQAPFAGVGAEPGTAWLMHQLLEHPYYGGADFEAVDLLYGNGAYSMTVLLPRNGKTVNDVVRGLDASRWATLTRELQKTKVDLLLPRFRLEYFRGLKPDLVGLGMGIAFSDQADFSGISRAAPLTLTRVDHKTFVEVNEEGTEAAAVTITGVGVTSLPQIVPFRVDRPFIFAIRERLSGAILFLGKMTHLP